MECEGLVGRDLCFQGAVTAAVDPPVQADAVGSVEPGEEVTNGGVVLQRQILVAVEEADPVELAGGFQAGVHIGVALPPVKMRCGFRVGFPDGDIEQRPGGQEDFVSAVG